MVDEIHVTDCESLQDECNGTIGSNALKKEKNSGPSSDEAQAPKPAWTIRKKLVLFTMCLTYFIALASVSIISPFFPNEALKKGASKTVIGMVFSTYPLLGVVLAPVYGIMIPKVGIRFTLIACFFLGGGTLILFGFLSMMPDGTIFIVFCFLLRVVDALAGAGMETSYYMVIATEFPDNIATVMGLMETFSGLGLMAGPAIGGVLYDLGGFKLPFIVLGGACWAFLPLVWILLPKDKERSGNEEAGSMLQTLKIPSIALIAFMCAGGGMAFSFLEPMLGPYLKKECRLSPSMIGLMFLLWSGTYTIMAPLFGWIGDKTKRYLLLMTVGFPCVAFGFLLVGPAPFFESIGLVKGKVWLVCIALVVIAVTMAASFVPLMPCMMQIAKVSGLPGDEAAISGIMSGIFGCMFNIGGLLGPTLSGALDEHLGFQWSTTIMAFFLGAEGFILLMFNICSRPMRRPSQAAHMSINDTEDERKPLLRRADSRTTGVYSVWFSCLVDYECSSLSVSSMERRKAECQGGRFEDIFAKFVNE